MSAQCTVLCSSAPKANHKQNGMRTVLWALYVFISSAGHQIGIVYCRDLLVTLPLKTTQGCRSITFLYFTIHPSISIVFIWLPPPLVCFLSPGLGFPHSLLLPHRLWPSGLPVPLSKGRTLLCCCCCLVSRTFYIKHLFVSLGGVTFLHFSSFLFVCLFRFSVFSSFHLIHADASAPLHPPVVPAVSPRRVHIFRPPPPCVSVLFFRSVFLDPYFAAVACRQFVSCGLSLALASDPLSPSPPLCAVSLLSEHTALLWWQFSVAGCVQEARKGEILTPSSAFCPSESHSNRSLS